MHDLVLFKWCPKCKQNLGPEDFYSHKKTHVLSGWCKKCLRVYNGNNEVQTAYNRRKRAKIPIQATTWPCARCRKVKSIKEYSPSTSNPLEMHPVCHTCVKEIAAEAQERRLKVRAARMRTAANTAWGHDKPRIGSGFTKEPSS